MAENRVTEPAGLIHVGRVSKPHGIRGELKIFSLAGRPSNFLTYRHLVFTAGEHDSQEYEVAKVRVQSSYAVVALAGVTDRNQAEELAGSEVWVTPDNLAPLADNEFYWHTVMGAKVVDCQGTVLGTLTSLLSAGGTDLMVVKTQDEELLIPSLPEFIVEVGPDKIIVDLPPGLVEINRRGT